MNKAQWKIYHRMLRIYRREMSKAWSDMLIFGNGYMNFSGPEPRHVPLHEVFL